MNRALPFILSPEALLAAMSVGVFVFCARHSSYSSADVRLLERLAWLLPLLVVGIAFGTMALPENRTWLALARVNVAVLVCLLVCGVQIVNGFGAPGSGPKGQDAGLILIVSLGALLSAVGNALCGAAILKLHLPAWANWSDAHPVGCTLVTAVAVVPIAFVQFLVTCLLVGVGAALLPVFKR